MKNLINKTYVKGLFEEGEVMDADKLVYKKEGYRLNIYQSGFNPAYHTIWYIQEQNISTNQNRMIAKIHRLIKGDYLELYENVELFLN